MSNIFCKLPGLKKYQPIKAEVVAKALIEGLQNENAKAVYESSKISELLS